MAPRRGAKKVRQKILFRKKYVKKLLSFLRTFSKSADPSYHAVIHHDN
jgi:hypothetical protein